MSSKRIRRKRAADWRVVRLALRMTLWPGNGGSFRDNLRQSRRDRVLQRQRMRVARVALRAKGDALLAAVRSAPLTEPEEP